MTFTVVEWSCTETREGRGGGEEGRGSNFHQHFSGHLTAIAWEIADAGFVLLPELRSWDVMGIQLVNVVRRAVCTTLDSVFRVCV